ncbi:alpha/beta hydrolase [Malacoplasma penetrans]|nr:alpha/beta hydrolase [Malacoplasma penetrans]RXY97131.1 alpha/beta hydrolase [Malacoplasma penetrans]
MSLYSEKDLDIELLEEKIIEPVNKTNESKHIVFIHGFASNSSCWELFVEKNKNHYIHLINLPGHGSKEYKPYHLIFKFIIDLIKKYIISIYQNYGPIILVGHSYGGAISATVTHELKEINENIIEKTILLAPYSKYSILKVIDKIKLFQIKNSDDFMELQKMIFVNAEKTVYELEKYLYKKLSLEFFKKNSKNLKWVILGMSLPSTFYKIDKAFKTIGSSFYFLFGEKDKLIDNQKTIQRSTINNIQPYFSIYEDKGHAFFAEDKDRFFNEIENIINL